MIALAMSEARRLECDFDPQKAARLILTAINLRAGFDATQAVVSSAAGAVLHPETWNELKGHAFAAGLDAAFREAV